MEAQDERMSFKQQIQVPKRKRTEPQTPTSPTKTSNLEQETANCLILLAQGQISPNPSHPFPFHCKTCTRCFPSFQALGGHMASHKKQKTTIEDNKVHFSPIQKEDIISLQMPTVVAKCKVHECSVCGAEYTSGQALGGHMRRHRTSNSNGSQDDEKIKERDFVSLDFDLNLPAPEDDFGGPKFTFGVKEQVIVFSASSLVNCHY